MNCSNLINNAYAKIISLIICVFVISGCSVVGQSRPTQFYVMSEASDALLDSKITSLPEHIQIAIGPIAIPGYSDRSQIVTIGAGSKLNVADLDHWAEPVQHNIERILVGNISRLTSHQQVFPYPANFHPSPESLQISVEIREMIQTETGLVRLSASWNIKRMVDNKLLSRTAQTYIKQEIRGDYVAFATSLSELFGRLAIDMVDSIEKVR